MEALAHHTAERIMMIPGMLERTEQLVEEDEVHYVNMEVDFKYGVDGMTGSTEFKQIGAEATDSGAIQASHFVVLQITTKINGVRRLVYTNPLCNSSISCRVLRYWFTKETTGKIPYTYLYDFFRSHFGY